MQIKDVMNHSVAVVHPDDTLAEAALKMRTAGMGLLAVCEGGRLAGMLTAQNVGEHAAAVGLAAGQARVRDAMDPNAAWCYEDDDLGDAERAITAHTGGQDLPGVLVLNRDGHVVGVLPTSAFHLDYQHSRLGGMGGGPIEDVVSYDQDPVDFMSEESFPASDPLPPP
jgi:CBS domain-containing protein